MLILPSITDIASPTFRLQWVCNPPAAGIGSPLRFQAAGLLPCRSVGQDDARALEEGGCGGAGVASGCCRRLRLALSVGFSSHHSSVSIRSEKAECCSPHRGLAQWSFRNGGGRFQFPHLEQRQMFGRECALSSAENKYSVTATAKSTAKAGRR